MMRRLLMLGAVAALGAAGLATFLGSNSMGWFDSSRKDLGRLLGEHAAVLLDDSARTAAWSPDSNFKPQNFYMLRDMDEATFRRAATRVGLPVGPAPAATDSVWRLPTGVTLPGWLADALPAGAGLQCSGTLGGAAVWMRWYQGHAYVVALVSGA
ncbi:MAG: hypothetical protein V4795_14640 [Pseudomonadota bacterium]